MTTTPRAGWLNLHVSLHRVIRQYGEVLTLEGEMSDDGFYRFDGIIRMGELPRTNIDDALEIVADIQKIYSVQRELKAAFARSELEGGVKAAPSHPLYAECERRLEKLRDQLKMVF